MKTEVPKISDTGRYTVLQTAEILGVDRHTLARWCKAGRIRASATNGRRRYFRAKDIIEAFKRN